MNNETTILNLQTEIASAIVSAQAYLHSMERQGYQP